MSLPESIGKAIAGDEDAAIIRSGTLAVTRGAGAVAAAIVAVTQLEWGLDLTDTEKLSASLIAVGIWAFLAAADAIARGYATAHTGPFITALPNPMKGKLPSKPAADEQGWTVFLVKSSPHDPEALEYWVVKGDEAAWVAASEVHLGK